MTYTHTGERRSGFLQICVLMKINSDAQEPVISERSLCQTSLMCILPHVYYLIDKNQYSYFLLMPGHIPVV